MDELGAKTRPPSRRALRDASLIPHIRRVHKENYGVYGVRKMHKALRREGFEVPSCTVVVIPGTVRTRSAQGRRQPFDGREGCP